MRITKYQNDHTVSQNTAQTEINIHMREMNRNKIQANVLAKNCRRVALLRLF